MPNTTQERMEDMSIAYVQAISAYNGYSVDDIKRDNDGVDLTIKCKGRPADGCRLLSPQVNVQMKSSFSTIHVNEQGDISYPLEVRNYNILVEPNLAIPTILILLHMHREEDIWIDHSEDHLKITKCAYWISLKGLEQTDNIGTKTIVIPRGNLLTPDALKSIMINISNCQEL